MPRLPKMSQLPWFQALIVLLVSGIFTVNILFIVENGRLKDRLKLMTDHVEIHPGDAFPSFSAVDLSGRLTEVSFENREKKLLVLLVSSVCPACLANLERWNEIVQDLDSNEWEVWWLSRDPWKATREFASEHGLSGRVLSEFSTREYRKVGLRLVPRTIILDPGGTVENIWVGRLEEDEWRDISSHLLPQFDVASSSP